MALVGFVVSAQAGPLPDCACCFVDEFDTAECSALDILQCAALDGNTILDTCGLADPCSLVDCTLGSCCFLEPAECFDDDGSGFSPSLCEFLGGEYTGHLRCAEADCPLGCDMTFCQLYDLSQHGRVDDVVGLSIATTSWNISVDTDCIWLNNPDEEHPFIVTNLYRFKDVDGTERFEQIGQSWIKHAFFALSSHQCGGQPCHYEPGTGHSAGDWLGMGCTDTYGSSLNANQSILGPRFEINPWTGGYLFPDSHLDGGHSHDAQIEHRLQVHDGDLEAAGNPGSTYYAEGYYVMLDDINVMNSAAWKPVTPIGSPGGTWSFGMTSAGTLAEDGFAIDAWVGATQTVLAQEVPPIEFDSPDGRCVLAAKATDLGGGTWHYEYALLNIDMDRQVGSFSIPISSGTSVSNVGFHAVEHHGETFNTADGDAVAIDNAPWSHAVTADAVTWSSTTNPLRWGTMYNFRFDADVGPDSTTVTLGMFRAGDPSTVTGDTTGPALPQPGACCDSTSTGAFCFMTDGGQTGCDSVGLGTVFQGAGSTCDLCSEGETRGACCDIPVIAPACILTIESEKFGTAALICSDLSGTYEGDGSSCAPGNECPPSVCSDDAECDDAIICTHDVCDPDDPGADVSGCVYPAVNCSANGDDCNDASCDPAGADGNCDTLTPANEGAACTSVDSCIENEVCTSGACVGTAVNCSAGNTACTTDSCDPAGAQGNCDTTTNKPDGTACGDPADTDCTNPDTCNSGSCADNNVVDGTVCDDGDACTESDMCSGGSCSGSQIPDCPECSVDAECDDGNVCTEDVCDPADPGANGFGCINTCMPKLFGDIVPAFCPATCPQPDLDDMLCLFDGFGAGAGWPAVCPDGDLHPCPPGNDGDIDLDDVLRVIDAFVGNPACPDPCTCP